MSIRRCLPAFALIALALNVAACGGGGTIASPGSSALPNGPAATTSAQLLYVPEANSVAVYRVLAGGNEAPLRTISGASTRISDPISVAVNSQGDIYVANTSGALTGGSPSCITIYAPNAHGDVPPIGDICGPHTNLRRALGHIAFDSAGDLYVATWDTAGPTNASILVFAPGAMGDAAPVRVIDGPDTGLSFPNGLAFDANGTLYVANLGAGPCGAEGSITEYAPDASGDASPVAFISGPNSYVHVPLDVAVDTSGHIYVDLNGGLAAFAPGSHGNVAPIGLIVGTPNSVGTPGTLISGSEGMALDAAGHIYASSLPQLVLVFPPVTEWRSDHFTPPFRVLQTSGLPGGITVH